MSPQMAQPNPMMASQFTGVAATENSGEAAPPSALNGSAETMATPMAVIATPFGFYAVQQPMDAAQMQALQQQQMMMQQQMMNPHMGFQATPFGFVGMNPMMMGHQPMMGQGGMSMSDVLLLMTLMNNNKQQRRPRMADRIAERRERRATAAQNDPFNMLMQAWTTPHVAPDTTLRMPARNAYPYGHFGAQALPMSTANYGGFHNLHFGASTFPGLY